MSKRTIFESGQISNLADLREELSSMWLLLQSGTPIGFPREIDVLFEADVRFKLIESTLSDGSKVYDFRVVES